MQVLLECTELGVQGPLTWQPHNIKTVIKGVVMSPLPAVLQASLWTSLCGIRVGLSAVGIASPGAPELRGVCCRFTQYFADPRSPQLRC